MTVELAMEKRLTGHADAARAALDPAIAAYVRKRGRASERRAREMLASL